MASLSINSREGGGKADALSTSLRSQPSKPLPTDAEEDDDDMEDEHNSLQDSSLLYGTFSTMPRSPGAEGTGCCGFFTKLMAVLIAAYITLVDNVPYVSASAHVRRLFAWVHSRAPHGGSVEVTTPVLQEVLT